MKVSKDILERLNKYPNLKEAVYNYNNKTDWDLINWFSDNIDQDDLPTVCNWDSETEEDFFSWGHNSRWANTFYIWLSQNPERAVEIALIYAEEHNVDNKE